MGYFPAAFCLAFALPGLLSAQLTTKLSPEADHAFDEYTKAVEAKLDWQPQMVLDKPGVTTAPGAAHPTFDSNGALIHDWMGAALAPHTTVQTLLAVLQSYDDYPRLYAPQITASKVLRHDGNFWRVYLKLHKKKLLTANLASEYDIEYRPLRAGQWGIISRSSRVAEVDGSRELPVGQGHGFLWRLNAYWLLEQRGSGVYIQCHAISMSRDVPVGLGWAMKPMVTSVPRESLRETLEDTLRAANQSTGD